MNKYKVVLALVVLFAISLVGFAQMTEQSENECFEGGLLFGQCNSTDVDLDGTVDEEDVIWMYKCGYYLAQADDNLIDREDIPLEGCELPEREIPRPEKTKEPVKNDDDDGCIATFPVLNGLQAQALCD